MGKGSKSKLHDLFDVKNLKAKTSEFSTNEMFIVPRILQRIQLHFLVTVAIILSILELSCLLDSLGKLRRVGITYKQQERGRLRHCRIGVVPASFEGLLPRALQIIKLVR